MDEKNPFRKPEQMRTQVAEFKQLTRMITKYAVCEEEDKWQFPAAYDPIPRLRGLAIEGRQLAIRGMPVVNDDDVEAIVTAIMSKRGADKKKHKEAMQV